MDINLRFFSRLSQWFTDFMAPKSALKSESDDAQQGLISLKTIANQYPLNMGQGQLQQVLPLRPFYSTERFINRQSQLTQMRDVISLWRNHHGEVSAIVAPAGAGLSAFLGHMPILLQQIRDDSENTPSPQAKSLPDKWLIMSFYQAPLSAIEAIKNVCHCFNIAPPSTITDSSITETIYAINQQTPQLIIIDDLHKLMLRMMGNNQALVTFATIIMETRKHHCWILGCEKYAWQRLSAQYQITHFIKHVITFDYFNANDLAHMQTQQLVALGLISNDYLDKIDDAANEPTQKSSTPDKEAVNPYDDQLKQLHTISQGHPKLATLLLHYSLANQDEISSENHHQTDICKINSSALQLCQDNDLFSLAEIYVHGGLKVEQHAHIFAQTIEQSSLQLSYLARHGLIIAQYSQQDFAQHFYFITPTLSKIIASYLVNNNKLFN
ncbi:hypothetical protein [Shewanella litoralis]|uniref:ATP-binding protein n=1 Tax=Shewanella litoralis TaxID=2282700 RepID=A0ABQ2RGR1_9GAMM|nr:hypothetical protein [Shewanella litoralis]GGQ24921.1 hypothetical protein GCM10009411_26130 [Shewanella litoralis]